MYRSRTIVVDFRHRFTVINESPHEKTGPDSVMVRALASEVGGAGSNPGRVIPKTLKMVPVATFLGARH